MGSIRIREWTKKQLEKVREDESHSSYDSVIKALLKDRQAVQLLQKKENDVQGDLSDKSEVSPALHKKKDKTFDNLTVVNEIVEADDGVMFLWCANCANEMAHLTLDGNINIEKYESKCQQCLTENNEHTTVAIEIGYPLEERQADETLHRDLIRCVVDYWDRVIKTAATSVTADTDADTIVTRFSQYQRQFEWDWPDDIPVITLEPGETYRNKATGDVFKVVERTSTHRDKLDSYRINQLSDDLTVESTETLANDELLPPILSRRLYKIDTDDNKFRIDEPP